MDIRTQVDMSSSHGCLSLLTESSIYQDGLTALHLAAAKGHVNMSHFLVEQGISVDIQDKVIHDQPFFMR